MPLARCLAALCTTLISLLTVASIAPAAEGARNIILSTTTSTQDMVAPQTQAVIKGFGVEKYGQPLFVPVAGKREEEIGG